MMFPYPGLMHWLWPLRLAFFGVLMLMFAAWLWEQGRGQVNDLLLITIFALACGLGGLSGAWREWAKAIGQRRSYLGFQKAASTHGSAAWTNQRELKKKGML